MMFYCVVEQSRGNEACARGTGKEARALWTGNTRETALQGREVLLLSAARMLGQISRCCSSWNWSIAAMAMKTSKPYKD